MVDLHVLVMPATLWKDHLKSAENGVIPETISAGFIRYVNEVNIVLKMEHKFSKDFLLHVKGNFYFICCYD